MTRQQSRSITTTTKFYGPVCRNSECGLPLTPENTSYSTRGLCNSCYSSFKYRGELHLFPVRAKLGICAVVDTVGLRCKNPAIYCHPAGELISGQAVPGPTCTTHQRRLDVGSPLDLPVVSQIPTTARDVLGRKQCRRCERWFSETKFSRNVSTKDGLGRYCARCDSDQRHNLAWDRKLEILTEQGHLCPCGQLPLLDEDNYFIDHDHKCCPDRTRADGTRIQATSCGKCIRALVHPQCNAVLGLIGENSAALRSLADYIDGLNPL